MGLLRDKNGKTEAEYLRDYDITQYFCPSVTVDAVPVRMNGDGFSVLLIKRGGHPFLGDYAFAGGFVEKDESCEQAAYRELFEETGITDIKLRQFATASTPGRDPRWRNISVLFCGRYGGDAKAGDDADACVWADVRFSDGVLTLSGGLETQATLKVVRDGLGYIDINATEMLDRGRLAFDHAKLLAYLYEAIMLRGFEI